MTESTPENTHESLHAHEIGRAAIDDAIDESNPYGLRTPADGDAVRESSPDPQKKIGLR